MSAEGPIDVNMTEIPIEEMELKFSTFFDIKFGGHWKPKDCKPRWKVGVCVCVCVCVDVFWNICPTFLKVCFTF